MCKQKQGPFPRLGIMVIAASVRQDETKKGEGRNKEERGPYEKKHATRQRGCTRSKKKTAYLSKLNLVSRFSQLAGTPRLSRGP